ncbi:MAG: hypothetical protein PHI98_09310 [Eubacteriales bacterium]|nr:hypothetical protein [Eubacteriales bacterium]
MIWIGIGIGFLFCFLLWLFASMCRIGALSDARMDEAFRRYMLEQEHGMQGDIPPKEDCTNAGR